MASLRYSRYWNSPTDKYAAHADTVYVNTNRLSDSVHFLYSSTRLFTENTACLTCVEAATWKAGEEEVKEELRSPANDV